MGELPKDTPIAIVRHPNGKGTYLTGTVEVPLGYDGMPDLSRVLFHSDQPIPSNCTVIAILSPDIREL